MSEYAAALLRALPHLFLPFLLLYEDWEKSFEKKINITIVLQSFIVQNFFPLFSYIKYENTNRYH